MKEYHHNWKLVRIKGRVCEGGNHLYVFHIGFGKLQERLGHSKHQTMLIYTLTSHNPLGAAADKLEKINPRLNNSSTRVNCKAVPASSMYLL